MEKSQVVVIKFMHLSIDGAKMVYLKYLSTLLQFFTEPRELYLYGSKCIKVSKHSRHNCFHSRF